MVINSKNVRAFRQGYEEVYQLGNQTVAMVVTDLTKFNKYGVTQADVDNLIVLKEEIGRDFDEVALTAQKLVTEAKDKMTDLVKELLYDFDIEVSQLAKNNSIAYKSFKTSNIRSLNSNETVTRALTSCGILKDVLADTLSISISPELVEALETNALLLRDLIDKQKTKEGIRHLATQVRVNKANALYAEISRIRSIGRKMWALTDYVKSSMYKMPRTNGSAGNDLNDDNSFPIDSSINSNDTDS